MNLGINNLKRIIILVLIGFNPHVSANSGISGGVGAGQFVVFLFLLWLGVSLLLGWFWYKKINRNWVWVQSPLIVASVSVIGSYLFVIAAQLITRGTLASVGKMFFVYLTGLIVGLLFGWYWYKNSKVERVRNIIQAVIIPMIFLLFLLLIWAL